MHTINWKNLSFSANANNIYLTLTFSRHGAMIFEVGEMVNEQRGIVISFNIDNLTV
jgi:hypothetical protein